ncbi:uncharacterized protein LOC128204338 [Mya arenaria]|uniref:uncharacterized protein LOC128204338 n=1 Tax=Mya arenaria TaxID=6604 RepID=UPI0022E21E9C|nr:uncharacterized protein LOC128204338 [Mya arenaria]
MAGILQLLLLISVSVASEPSCPACSKYDYEEKMLERMIHMELAFEKLGEKVQQNLNNIKDEKKRFLEQAEHKLASLMDEAKKNQSSTLQKIEVDSNNTLEQAMAAFNDIKDQIVTPLVYFNAHSPQTSSLSTGEVIMYKTVQNNPSNGYSSTTGKFTAPVRGLYLFLMHTCTHSKYFALLKMMKEGSVLISTQNYDKDHYTCSSSQVFVQLDAGESVWVQCSSGGSNRQLYEDHPYRWTSFGGALIHN